MMPSLRALTALALLGVLAPPVSAQVAVTTTPRGWVGVSFEVQTTREGSSITSVNRITEVMPGSPAEAAGVRAGDILVSINGRDWRDGLSPTLQTLRPGDAVSLTVAREGRQLQLRLTAGTRPVEALAPPVWNFTVRPDSLAEYLYKAMDSLRIRIAEGDGRSYRVTTLSGDSVFLAVTPGATAEARLRRVGPEPALAPTPFEVITRTEAAPGGVLAEVRPPFGFYLFRSAAHDSLRAEMDALNDEIRGLRSRQAARTRELARTVRGDEARIDRDDPELRALAQQLNRLTERGDALRRAMEEAARTEAVRERSLTLVAPRGADAEEAEVTLRPLAPYVLGQNRAAGAEVVDLRPELASYFQVAGGVLVVDVPGGTPAHAAGILPGDVLTAVDGEPVRNIVDLRRGLAAAGADLRFTLVRKGRTLQVHLTR